ncbi:MAG TPA: hypothetical protein VFM58_07170 [Solirubrobacteraceae bacterium]|nr:hypothetical protein [Solirubrobacteraceae bacterium]
MTAIHPGIVAALEARPGMPRPPRSTPAEDRATVGALTVAIT